MEFSISKIKAEADAFTKLNMTTEAIRTKNMLKRYGENLKAVEEARKTSQRYCDQYTRLIQEFQNAKADIIQNAVDARVPEGPGLRAGNKPAQPRLPRQVGKLVPVRELSALTSPWYFGAVPAAPAGRSRKFATAWSQLQDPKGFLHR